MNSEIRIYSTQITPQRNLEVDELDAYLATLTPTYSNTAFQYIQLGLDISIVVNLPQDRLATASIGNYVAIKQDNRTWYYFILNAVWKSQKAVQLNLSIDSINTFKDLYKLSNRTLVLRQHKDRIASIGTTSEGMTVYRRLIDKEPEGLNTPKFDETLNHYDSRTLENFTMPGTNWYLIYKTNDELSVNNPNNPVKCLCVSDREFRLIEDSESNPIYHFNAKNLVENLVYAINIDDSPKGSITFDGTTYELTEEDRAIEFKQFDDVDGKHLHISINRYIRNGELYQWKEQSFYKRLPDNVEIYLNNVRTFYKSNVTNFIRSYTDVLNIPNKEIINSGIEGTYQLIPFKQIDRTDSRIIKIINLPYPPDSSFQRVNGVLRYDRNRWEFKNGVLQLKDISSEFFNENATVLQLPELIFEADSPDLSLPQFRSQFSGYTGTNPTLESKMFHSDFYTVKVMYDDFAKEIKLENLLITNTPSLSRAEPLDIYWSFKPTNTINSKFAFLYNIAEQDDDNGDIYSYDYHSDTDYEKFLIVDRNNEETIFSNDYVNYIRNGYNYDQKAHMQDNWQKSINAVAGILGGGGSAAAAFGSLKGENSLGQFVGVTSGLSTAVKAITNISDIIISDQQFHNQMDSKLAQLAAQSTNVAGSDDMDLLRLYNKNKLNVAIYETKPEVGWILEDLFYYTGYACNQRQLPNTQSRYWFNFLQCDAVITQRNEAGNNDLMADYVDDIKARYAKGVTRLHRRQGIYDWKQQWENWEINLLPDNI